MQELSIIQKTYDLIKWYIPILNRLPRDHKFLLGDRIISGLYSFLEKLIIARYARDKLAWLEPLNGQLDIFRYQTRLLLDFELIALRRYEHVNQLLNDIGMEFSRSHALRGNAGSGRSASCATARRRASRQHSHAERGNERR